MGLNSDVESKLKDIPDKYLIIIAQLLAGHINDSDTFDAFNKPILKPSIKNIYWIFIIQYAVLAVLGIISNIGIIAYTMYYKLYKDVTHAFIVNLALCHFVQCAIVLPITLMVMLIQNWIFGQFLCFFLPLLQDIPLHVAMISHLLIAWDRLRWLGDPVRGRLPAFVCCCATWLTGMVIALPYPIYTIYLELGDYVPRLNGVGLCFVNLVDDIHEYMRGLFVIMYCGPTVLLAYLYIRTSRELRPPDGPFAVMMFEHRADIRNRQRNSSTSSIDHNGRNNNSTKSYNLYNAELDVSREKRTQRHLGSMAATQVLCVCPLMILRLARMVLIETYENSSHFDLTYLMFVWIAFLPTVIFPCIYASEILPSSEKERLRGYFRLSFKRTKRSDSSRQESTESQDNVNMVDSLNRNSINEIQDNIKNDERKRIAIAAFESNRRKKTESKGRKLDNSSDNRGSIGGNSGSGGGGVVAGVNIINNNHIHPPALKRLSGSINNSCSNITSSTYCNNGTEQSSVDFESNSVLSIDNDPQYEKKWIKHDDINDGANVMQFIRNDSSSTFDCDMEIIDLLDKERGIDGKNEKCEETSYRTGTRESERRKLPTLERVCKSPFGEHEINFEYPTYSQYRNKRANIRKSSYKSLGRMKRGSLKATHDEIIGVGVDAEIGAGVFGDRDSINKMSMMDSKMKRCQRTSISSGGRSSMKSRDYVSPQTELDFRENIFADL